MKGLLALIFLMFAPSVFGQRANAPQTAPPQTSTPLSQAEQEKAEKDFELNKIMMESTFMIEGRSIAGPTIGTAFVIGRQIPNTDRARYVMVTAAHVLEEMQGDVAVIHLRRKVDEATNTWVDVPTTIAIRANNQPLWKRHLEADVAAMYIGVPDEEAIILVGTQILADDKMLTEYEIKPGDELRCLGFPLGVASNSARFPVLRSGRIASYPLLPTDKTKTFLLDFRVFKGNSGGPVFFFERYRLKPGTLGGYTNYHFIMGMVSQEVL
jgi:hypothetical protein